MPQLFCTHCHASVPVVATHVSDLAGNMKIGPCCIEESDADLEAADFSDVRFIGVIDQSIVRVNQKDARAMMASYRASHPPVATPAPEPAPVVAPEPVLEAAPPVVDVVEPEPEPATPAPEATPET